MTTLKSVQAGRQQYADQHSPRIKTTRTYTAQQVRSSSVVRGMAVFDAAQGNESARIALQDAAAVDAAIAARDPLLLETGEDGIDVTPPTT